LLGGIVVIMHDDDFLRHCLPLMNEGVLVLLMVHVPLSRVMLMRVMLLLPSGGAEAVAAHRSM
jgi:hypothetical protein